jgi:hypothetical protein
MSRHQPIAYLLPLRLEYLMGHLVRLAASCVPTAALVGASNVAPRPPPTFQSLLQPSKLPDADAQALAQVGLDSKVYSAHSWWTDLAQEQLLGAPQARQVLRQFEDWVLSSTGYSQTPNFAFTVYGEQQITSLAPALDLEGLKQVFCSHEILSDSALQPAYFCRYVNLRNWFSDVTKQPKALLKLALDRLQLVHPTPLLGENYVQGMYLLLQYLTREGGISLQHAPVQLLPASSGAASTPQGRTPLLLLQSFAQQMPAAPPALGGTAGAIAVVAAVAPAVPPLLPPGAQPAAAVADVQPLPWNVPYTHGSKQVTAPNRPLCAWSSREILFHA